MQYYKIICMDRHRKRGYTRVFELEELYETIEEAKESAQISTGFADLNDISRETKIVLVSFNEVKGE